MKKRMIAVLLVAISLSMTACGDKENPIEATNPPSQSSIQEEIPSPITYAPKLDDTSIIVLTQEDVAALLPGFGELKHITDSEESPVVYMTTDISPEGLMAAYKALGRIPTGNVAIKLHTGEGVNSYNLEPDFIKNLVQSVNGTIVECNTAYGGSRASTALHMQVARDRGYTAIAPVDIMDADGGVEIPVVGGKRLDKNQVGAHFINYDFFIMLSHFKGHLLGGFGGALKNMSIGIASREGKSLIHTAGADNRGLGFNTPADVFTECMAEAAKSVCDYLDSGNKLLCINVVNNISVDCDCNANPAKPDMHGFGSREYRLASIDRAIDKSSVDRAGKLKATWSEIKKR